MTLSDAPAGARRRALLALAVAGLLTMPLLVITSGTAQAASITWSRRASGLAQPVQVTSAQDGVNRLFVVEKAGEVRVVKKGKVLARPFLDIRGKVNDAGEGGLLSIAFHPDYLHHPLFWVAYTNNAGDVQVSRFRATRANSNTAQ